MIPSYPEFDKLELKHKEAVESFTGQFEPYSDFNFISLYCWDIDGSVTLSNLNGNLVIQLPDYLTGRSVHSIIGNREIDITLTGLVQDVGDLKLVPEPVIISLVQNESFDIHEDPDNFDYIFSVQKLAELSKAEFNEKGKKANRFARKYIDKYQVFQVTSHDESTTKMVNYVMDWWKEVKNRPDHESQAEREAIFRLLQLHSDFNLLTHILTVENVPIGFSVHELLNNGFAISHFHKTLPVYKHADVFLNRHIATDLLQKGCKTVNWEQDLGIEGLKRSKMSYHPDGFLKKYTVKRVN